MLPFAVAANSLALPAIGGARPIITNFNESPFNGITLASGNTIRGVEVGYCTSGVKIFGNNFGTLTIGNTGNAQLNVNSLQLTGFNAGVFTFSEGNNGATPRDWLARYVLFMGMGGTLAKIPPSVIQLVSATPFYGEVPRVIPLVNDANMLEPAALKCSDLMNDKKGDGVRMEVRLSAAL